MDPDPSPKRQLGGRAAFLCNLLELLKILAFSHMSRREVGQVPVLLSTLSHAESPWFGPCALRGWLRVLPAASVSLLCSISKRPLDVQLSHRASMCLEPYPSLDPKPALSGHSAALNNSSFFLSLQLEIAESCLICLSVSLPTANRLSNHFKLVPQPVLSHSHSCWSDCHAPTWTIARVSPLASLPPASFSCPASPPS